MCESEQSAVPAGHDSGRRWGPSEISTFHVIAREAVGHGELFQGDPGREPFGPARTADQPISKSAQTPIWSEGHSSGLSLSGSLKHKPVACSLIDREIQM